MAVSRRDLLRSGVYLGAGALLAGQLRDVATAASTVCPQGRGLEAIEHIVFLMQENRSFDHYFGTLRGVRGFDDHARGRRGVFAQPFDGQHSSSPRGQVWPFHFDAANGPGSCSSDVSHAWTVQHQAWNHGRMDRFVEAHLASDGAANAPMTMGYYKRADLPFLYALADAFTVCDSYHASLLGPTWPNRIMALTGTIDPDGKHGGPVVDNPSPGPQTIGSGNFSWTTMPEVLQDHGISWKVYSQAATNNNVLSLFSGYTSPSSPLFRNALLPTWPANFQADVATGTLPQVSWVLAPAAFDEHPSGPIAWGEWVTYQVVSTLVRDPKIWAKTLLVISFDENGGMFDHVAPPTPPPGTTGEYLTAQQLPAAAGGIRGPLGLGFRVPALIVSPFSRGGAVCSDVFDHTSTLRLLETRFGVRAPNISQWRRRTCGDLTSTLDLGTPNYTVPLLPDITSDVATAAARCGPQGLASVALNQVGVGANPGPVYPLPPVQEMPRQEPGRVLRRGSCAPTHKHR